MQIVLLGAGGYHPNSHRHTACMMLPELGIVLDAGTAAFRIPQYLQTDHLDIYLSHAHLDHVMGLTFLIGLFDDPQKITVRGEAEKLDAIRNHLFSKLLFPIDPGLKLQPLADSPIALPGDGTLTWFPVNHPGGAVGYRLDWPGHSLAYVTDTVASTDAAYLPHIQNVDLLIHEAYFDDAQRNLAVRTGHSCVTDVAEVAAAVNAKRLVLTHMNPRADTPQPLDLTKARERFADIEFGADELVIEF